MATIKLVIRKDKVNSRGECLIYVLYTHNQKSIKVSTEEKIKPCDWDSIKGQVKKSYGKGYDTFNDTLKIHIEKVERIKRLATQRNIEPTIDHIKEQLALLERPILPDTSKDFFKMYENFIEESKSRRAYNTIKQHRTAINHLISFQQTYKYTITLESINMDFYVKFTSYLSKELQLNPNSVGDILKNLKIFLNELTEKGINTNLTFKSKAFKKPSAPVEITTLTQQELDTLFTLELSDNKKLDKVRDLFIFSCTTGLRFSDMANLKPENIKEDTIEFITIKTKDQLSVPIIFYARQILVKYGNKLPRVMSNQKMNDYLKELGKVAGLSHQVQKVKFLGVKRIDTRVPKFELLSTHTARRTFVTLSLEKGMRPEEVMRITGHKNIKTLMKYVKITNQVVKTSMLRAWS
ncbi:site-specific integrase [Rhodocytophaga aerolata]|uniref:Site-specific integrase n=1 Tax=Rhodocytophaga aerolata TaxID=455078 RepID=A0ABT8RIN9_9BACT|nr:site-specific integrase [Rhodocytophaga aerolata]MDO1451028.1 site-specific integrase [Rhodocytophaga aerolata]